MRFYALLGTVATALVLAAVLIPNSGSDQPKTSTTEIIQAGNAPCTHEC
jgi:hypothetical protein